MLVSKTRRTREHHGPTPHSVAIIARPPHKKPPDSLILERRKKDEQRLKVQEEVMLQKHHDLKTQWEKETDVRIQKNTVKRRVETILKKESFDLEQRREKLRALLDAEEEQYLIDIDAQQETTLERQAKMRARAKALREKREQERLALVEEKLDIRWREECDELRPILARQHQNEVFAERAKQIEIAGIIKEREKEEEDMYAALWESDRIMKIEREERECAAAIQRNKDCLSVLEKQLAAIRLQQENAKALKAEEARLMEEEKKQREAEERHLLQVKRAQQTEAREHHTNQIKLKARRQAKELQGELAIDMKILEALLTETENEKEEAVKRKGELHKEAQAYMRYLGEQVEKEREAERELEKLIDAEVEKQWQKRMQQWQLEREARRKMTEEMVVIRKQQIAEKLQQQQVERDALLKEREELKEAFAEHERLEKEKVHRTKQRNLAYQSDLMSQVAYTSSIRDTEVAERTRELDIQNQAEERYQTKLAAALQTQNIDRAHPLRQYHRTQDRLFG